MKNTFILGLLMLLMVGCGTLGTMRKAFISDPGVSAEDKRGYLEHVENVKAATAQFRPYHYLAITLIAFGGWSVFGKGNTTVGISSLATGIGISAWATYAPSHPKEVGVGLLILFLTAGAVVVYRVLKKPKACNNHS